MRVFCTCPLALPGVRVGFGGLHPGKREVISVLLSCVYITRRLECWLLLEALRVVERWHARILPHAGHGESSRSDVGKAGLLQGPQGRRRVHGVHLPAHVEAGRRTVVISRGSLVGAGVFKNLRGVERVFPIHGWRGPEAAHLRSCLGVDLQLLRTCGATARPQRAPHRCVPLTPCDPAAHQVIGFTVCTKRESYSGQFPGDSEQSA